MKTLVITGSTRGIGRGLAEGFLARGCKVVLNGRRQQAVEKVVGELAAGAEAERVAGCAGDVSRHEDLQALWRCAVDAFGRVDVWINNAGISIHRAPLWEQPAADLEAIVNTNLTGLLLANKVALAGMKEQGGGQIWNMEGFGSNGMAQPGLAAYGATKRAVDYLNKALRKDAAGTGVQICALSPGIVVTDLLVGDYDLHSEQWQKAKRTFNILGDNVETVAPHLVEGILKANRDGTRVAWLTIGKAMRRFLAAPFSKRELFAHLDATNNPQASP